MNPLSRLVLVLLLAQPAEGKLFRTILRLGGDELHERWGFLTAFGFSTGIGNVEISARALDPQDDGGISVTLFGYTDDAWSALDGVPSPCGGAPDGQPGPSLSNPLTVPGNGDWTSKHVHSITHVVRSRAWYFVVAACGGQLQAGSRLEVELHTFQEDRSEFDCWMRPVAYASGFVLLLLGILVLFFWRRCTKEKLAVHPVLYALLAVMLTQCMAHGLHSLHQWTYGSNGYGSWALEAISGILFLLSQMGQSTLMILIAEGYTVSSQQGQLETTVPISIGVSLIHVALALAHKLSEGGTHRHHEYEGAVGWIFVALRLGLFVWFAWSIKRSLARSGCMLDSFLRHFAAAGTLYFLAYPGFFLLAQVMAPYLREPVYRLGLLAAQTASDAWMVFLFTSSRGSYRKVSELGQSILPGAGFASSMSHQD